jgi:DNA-binding response OmpR family regulator
MSKILVAEDDPYLSRYIQTILTRWGCDVVVEQTAERAILRAGTFKPDVALLGFITPGMDGAKAGVKFLMHSPETRVVLTVESAPSEVLDDPRARGYVFQTLVAPFKVQELHLLCFPSLLPRVE